MNCLFRTYTIGLLLLGLCSCSRAGANPSPIPTSGSGECDNGFYPVVQGAKWSYEITGAMTGEFTRSITEATSTGFTDQDIFSTGIVHIRKWKCSDDALVATQPDEGATGPLELYSRMHDFQASMADGVTVPDELMPGTLWNEELLLEGTSPVNGQDAPARDSIKFECNASSVETISVPAGTFQAVRGNCKFGEKLTVTIGGVDQPSEIVTMSTVWYASGVGLIKSEQVAPDGQKTTVVLAAYKIP